jgi:D-arabinose 1-dehydrogenase-like Zn-dependent alcohol dehydrogenase
MKKYREPLSIEYIDVPEPRGEAVVVRIAGAGVCHSDLHLWRGELEGFPAPLPMVLGHENSGVVYARGEEVPDEFKEGTPVLVFGGWYDAEDEFTLSGDWQLARRAAWPGIVRYNGGYSEYMYVPSSRFLVPAHGIEDLAAASVLTDAGLTPYRAVRRLKPYVSPDDYVAVVGLGGLGIFGAQYVKSMLAARAIMVDVRDEALEMASRIVELEGSDLVLNAGKVDVVQEVMKATGGRGVRAVVDFVGSAKTLETYLKVMDTKGVYVIVGLHSAVGPPIPIQAMVTREIAVMGSLWGNIKELYEVAALARRDAIRYREVVRKIGLEDVMTAFEKLERGEVSGRLVIAF